MQKLIQTVHLHVVINTWCLTLQHGVLRKERSPNIRQQELAFELIALFKAKCICLFCLKLVIVVVDQLSQFQICFFQVSCHHHAAIVIVFGAFLYFLQGLCFVGSSEDRAASLHVELGCGRWADSI